MDRLWFGCPPPGKRAGRKPVLGEPNEGNLGAVELKWLQADGAWLEGELVHGVSVGIWEGRIERIERGPAPGQARRVEGVLLPGAIDLQVNGAGGHGVELGTPEALDGVARTVHAGGASAFLPTLITAPMPALLERIAAVADWIEARSEAVAGQAVALGLHVEGPFLEASGAHPEADLVDPTPERVDAILEAGRGLIRLVTLAPDRPGAPEAVSRLVEAGVCVAIGHAHGTRQLEACIEAGASMVTHLFNAMSGLHHRESGIAAHALADTRLCSSIIVDSHHVSREAALVAWRCLGPERTVLVTDAVSAAGMPDGPHTLSGMPVELRDGAVRDRDGRLAGSSLSMAGAVCGLGRVAGMLEPGDVAAVTSENPARLLGDRDRGQLRPGAPAEIAVLGPRGQLTALLP